MLLTLWQTLWCWHACPPRLALNIKHPWHPKYVYCDSSGIPIALLLQAWAYSQAEESSGTLPYPISGFYPISGHPLTRYRVMCPDIGVFFWPDIGTWHKRKPQYRDMSHVTRYRVPISGTHPISGHHVTDIVNHIHDIGINIGYNIGCPDIGDMISRYQWQYRVPISGVPISGYDGHPSGSSPPRIS